MTTEHAPDVEDVDDVPAMPFASACPLDEPVESAPLRRRPGLARLPTGTGDAGWLVTRREDLRKLSADPRIGRSHPDPDRAPRLWNSTLFKPPAAHGSEAEDHLRWRRAVAVRLGAAHTDSLRQHAGGLFDELLDTMITSGAPGDLHAALAEPFANRLNLDVVGIPHRDHERVRDLSDDIRADDHERASAALTALTGYLAELLEHKRRHPAADALSDLVTTSGAGDPATPAQALEGARLLVTGAYETVATRISLGILALLTHPDQYEALAARRTPAQGAVEEILRYAVPGGSWIPRYARTDIDYQGTRIRAGDLVVFLIQSANRDESVFDTPDRFDITRERNPHVGFGHGTYHCIGAPLARLALTTVLEKLPPRLPGLRLHDRDAGPATNNDKITGGLRILHVTW